MRMENKGPAGRTRPQVRREAALRRGLAGAPLVTWCMRYVAGACAFASRSGPIRCVPPPDAIQNQELIVFPPSSALILPATGILSVTPGGHVGKIDPLHHLRMAARAKKVGGAGLKRFVVHSALLSLIDPVRGEPTRTPLDENPDAISGGQQLKQKFLDSFALICSTSSKGAETASAVCLEQHDPAGAILRVARNRGLTPNDLTGLEDVLQILRVVARKEKSSTQAELDILRLVVDLDRARILSIAEKVKKGIRNLLQEAQSRLLTGQVKPEALAKPGLKPWLDRCPFTVASLRDCDPATMVMLVDWASQARWPYSEQLQSLLGLGDTQKPPWLDSLHKIARYHSAIKSMVKLAAKQPEVLAGIQIREVRAAPDPRPFPLPNWGADLLTAVRQLVGKEDSRVIMEQLEKHLEMHLGTQDVEAQLRRPRRLNLTLHAEMQIVVFYEGNGSPVPRMPFIGTSKKACFLCHEYLLRHPLRLRVSACHQKIYPSWMPPPYYPIPGQKFPRTPFTYLSEHIEQLTRSELKNALTAPRRPPNQDSTAGPPLTTTATESTGLGSWRPAGIRPSPGGGGRSEDLG
ncbi:hypothetical protein MAPG_10670 [Magnaporthiopsis poae ATCC 64411]|uniref:Uncharacterized protein n=1 Tax=Magnaporthiopsis poae (strain ATCC 64411 / 73-15) TaxID=644358 RepID=A0A0C4ED77_MAGP6|nr:hypothetical protein MAPG_10670 [Magnaporthiopsis poae ATCC 64411]